MSCPVKTLEEMVKTYYKPSWSDLWKLYCYYSENDDIEYFKKIEWLDDIICGWGEKKWRIPLLPDLSDKYHRALKIRTALPHLSNTDINKILRDCNKILKAIREEEKNDPDIHIKDKPKGK